MALRPLFPNTVLGWNFSRDPKNLSVWKRKDGGTKKRRKKDMDSEKRLGNPCTNLAMVFKHLHYILCTFPPFLRLFCTVCTVHLSTILQTGNSRSVSSLFLFFFCVKRRSNNAWGEIGGGGRKEQSALLFFVIVVASLSLPPTTRFEEWKLKRQKSMREMEGRAYFLFFKKNLSSARI